MTAVAAALFASPVVGADKKGRQANRTVVGTGWKSESGSSTNTGSDSVLAKKSNRDSANLKWRRHRTARRASKKSRGEVRRTRTVPADEKNAVRPARAESVDAKNAVRHAVGLGRSRADQREVTLDDLDPFDDTAVRSRVVTPEPIAEEIGQQRDAPTQDPTLGLPAEPFDDDEPSLEELAQRPRIREEEECPLPSDLKPITEVTDDISAEGVEFPPECTLGDAPYIPRQFAMTTYTWKASGLCHKPLYFEQVGLERYGHSFGPFVQPVISGAHFFATIPILPYKMGLEPPFECVYTLGYYRPGNCAPRMILPLGLSLRGGLAQAGVTTGLVFLIP